MLPFTARTVCNILSRAFLWLLYRIGALHFFWFFSLTVLLFFPCSHSKTKQNRPFKILWAHYLDSAKRVSLFITCWKSCYNLKWTLFFVLFFLIFFFYSQYSACRVDQLLPGAFHWMTLFHSIVSFIYFWISVLFLMTLISNFIYNYLIRVLQCCVFVCLHFSFVSLLSWYIFLVSLP